MSDAYHNYDRTTYSNKPDVQHAFAYLCVTRTREGAVQRLMDEQLCTKDEAERLVRKAISETDIRFDRDGRISV